MSGIPRKNRRDPGNGPATLRGGHAVRAAGALILRIGCLFAAGLASAAMAEDREDRGGDVAALMSEQRPAGRYGEELQRAWERFHSGDPGEALERFQAVLEEESLPESSRIQARYGIGYCHRFMRPIPDEARAVAVFEGLLEEYPDSDLTPWLLLELGILSRKKSADLEYEPNLAVNARSRGFFERILEEFPESVVVHEAAIRLSSSYFFEVEREYADRGVEILERHLRRYPDNPLIVVMHMRLSVWYFAVHRNFEKSQEHAVKLGTLRLSDPFRWSRNYWHIAQTYRFAFNDPAAAAPWFRRIIEEAPKSPHVFLARKILRQIERDLPFGIEAGGAP